ncbi:hypothetical protein V1511DRAFT_498772 [Dipodascopsis uninucleata]
MAILEEITENPPQTEEINDAECAGSTNSHDAAYSESRPSAESAPSSQDNSVDSEFAVNLTEDKFTPEEENQLIEESNQIKSDGNGLFAKEEYDNAIEKYEKALEICPKYLKKPQAVLWSNISACQAKKADWKEAVSSCTKSIDLDNGYIKPLVRRAYANEKLDTWSSLQSAVEDYKKLKEINSKSATEYDIAIARLQPKVSEAQKKETAEMIDKLKDLGNGILRPFGLSTDNFKMTPDGKGGYSMNFSR